nr:MAG TPA: Baseplate J like protein [Caudoviricetes sp.]
MYDVTFNEILERMISRVPNSFDKREGSIIYDALAPAALELQRVYIELNSILSDAYGDTASREYLILRCKERGVIPEQASKAILRGKFTPSGINVIGKRFNVNELNYVVTRALTDSDGGYEVQCETPGAIGNRTLGTMIPIEYIQGLETAELTEVIIPGEDDETTENLRKRYFDSFKESAFGGNVKDYINKVNAISGVSATKVKRVWNNDINPLELIPTQKVVDWANGVGMKSDPEVSRWLTAAISAGKEKKLTVGGTVLLTILGSDFNVASNQLIQTVQQEIDPTDAPGEGYGLAPIGHIVNVKSARGVEISVKTEITFETGYSWSNMRSAMEEAIKVYLLELCKSWASTSSLIVRIAQIETRILQIKGIVDIGNTAINGVNKNLALDQYEIPVFKEVRE